MLIQSASPMSAWTSFGETPAAYAPPTSAPMLVPAMQSTGMRSSSRTSSTPRCAPPRAPPPPRTSPMRALCWACAPAAASTTSTTVINRSVFFMDASDLEGEWRESRIPVVMVFVLGALEPAHDGVGDRREDDFDGDFRHELREHHGGKLVVGDDPGAVEGKGIEDERVDALAEDR